MPQSIRTGPFEKFNLSHRFWSQPNCFLHLFRTKRFAPSWSSGLWQIHERAGWRHEMPWFREHLPSRSRNKSVPSPRYVHQLIPFVVADDQRINAVRPREISADYELPAEINAMFYPDAAASARLVDAVSSLADDAFEMLFADGG